MAGFFISCESTCPVAFGQFISNCPRVTAACIAVGCLLARNWAWLVQPVETSKEMSAKFMNDFDIYNLLFVSRHSSHPQKERVKAWVKKFDRTIDPNVVLVYWTLVQYPSSFV